MIDKFTFCTLAFGDAYIQQLHRLKQSIRNIYPDVAIFQWISTYPHGAKPHHVSPYGFKVHAVNEARKQGYEKIIWLDTAVILQKEIDYWFTLTPKYGVLAARDESKLAGTCGDTAFAYFGVTLEESLAKNQHLVGGSAFIFDFGNPLCEKIFALWEKSEADGMFASEKRHRHDEACLSHALYLSGSSPVPYGECRYNDGPESIVRKEHFK